MASNVEQGFITELLMSGDSRTIVDQHIKLRFFNGENRKAFKIIMNHISRYGKMPSVRAFKNKFPEYELMTCDGDIGTGEGIVYWSDELKNKFRHNSLVDGVEESLKYIGDLKTDDAVKKLKSVLLELEEETVVAEISDINKGVQKRREDYLKRQRSGGMTGIPTGIEHWDKLTGGINTEELTAIMGFTGIGKSWFLIIIAVNLAKMGYRVKFFTTEMSREAIMRRIDAVWCSLNYSDFKKGQLKPDQEKRYFDYLDNIAKTDTFLQVENVTDGVFQIGERIEADKPDVALVDGAYLLADEDAGENWMATIKAFRQLHKICLLTKVPLIVTTQSKDETDTSLKSLQFAKALAQECLAPETLVMTNKGLVPIKTLEGTEFKVFNGVEYKEAICVNAGVKEAVRISFNGKEIISSTNHLFGVFDNEVGEFRLKYTKDLKPSDYLIEYDEKPFDEGKDLLEYPPITRGREITLPSTATKDLGTFIGYMLGDGCIRPFDKGQVVLSCGLERAFAEKSIEIVQRVFNIQGKIEEAPSTNGVQFRAVWYSRALSDFLRFFIESEEGKEFNSALYGYNREFRIGLITGLIQSDGDTSSGVRFTSTRNSLTVALKNLLTMEGVHSSISHHSAHRLYVKRGDVYKLENLPLVGVKKDSLEQFLLNTKRQGGYDIPSKYALYVANKVNTKGLSRSKQSSIYQARKKPTTSVELLREMEYLAGIKNDYSFKFVRISSLESVESREMYDISIKGDNKLFFAEGILTHNCDIVGALEQDKQMRNDREVRLKPLKLREADSLKSVYMNWDFNKMDYSSIYSESEKAPEVKEGDKEGVIDID